MIEKEENPDEIFMNYEGDRRRYQRQPIETPKIYTRSSHSLIEYKMVIESFELAAASFLCSLH
jgi:hypothetical protein